MKLEELKALMGDKLTDAELTSTLKVINEHVDSVRDSHFESKKEEMKSTLTSEVRSGLFKEYGFESEDKFKNAKSTFESTDSQLKKDVNTLTGERDDYKTKFETFEAENKTLNAEVFGHKQRSVISKDFNSERVEDVFDLARVRKTDENKFEDLYKDILTKNPSWSKDYKGRKYTTNPKNVNNEHEEQHKGIKNRFRD